MRPVLPEEPPLAAGESSPPVLCTAAVPSPEGCDSQRAVTDQGGAPWRPGGGGRPEGARGWGGEGVGPGPGAPVCGVCVCVGAGGVARRVLGGPASPPAGSPRPAAGGRREARPGRRHERRCARIPARGHASSGSRPQIEGRRPRGRPSTPPAGGWTRTPRHLPPHGLGPSAPPGRRLDANASAARGRRGAGLARHRGSARPRGGLAAGRRGEAEEKEDGGQGGAAAGAEPAAGGGGEGPAPRPLGQAPARRGR